MSEIAVSEVRPAAEPKEKSAPSVQISAESVSKEGANKAERKINAAQEAAIDSEARVTAVIAGPGTGKTFTLTERIARLAEKGVKPEEICAVTFTVRAAFFMWA